MNQNLVLREETGVATQQEQTVLQMIARAASDPSVDVAKMGELLSLQERIMAKQAEIVFHRAFALASKEMPRVAKNGVISLGAGKGSIPFVRYEDLDATIRPIEAKYGFTRSFSSEPTDKGVLMVVRLSHEGGHAERSVMQLPPDPGPGRNALQAIGSSHQYGRRYLTVGIWNIVTEGADDDGRAVGFVDDSQLSKLTDMLAACEEFYGPEQRPKVVSAFLGSMKVKALSEIQRKDYARAMQLIQATLRRLQEAK
jgi:hypothetical protein